MPNKLKISSASLVAKARKEIMEIDAKKAIGMVGLDDVVIVDIRDFRERQRTGYIRDSFHCQGAWRSSGLIQKVLTSSQFLMSLMISIQKDVSHSFKSYPKVNASLKIG